MNTTSSVYAPGTLPAGSSARALPRAWSGGVVDSGGITGMVSSIDADPPRNSVFSRLLHPRQAHHIPVEFTGSGAEYFRLWIVNLLLTLLTLGIYYPWAKVRKLQYFYGHTEVAGQSLDFHGDPRKMLRGGFLVAVLWAVYSQAMEMSGLAALAAATIVAVLAPALLSASLQFRVANTSWRGLRFAFPGTTRQAYQALAAPLLAGLLGLAAIGQYDDEAGRLLGFDLSPGAFGIAALTLFGLLLVAGPYVYWRLKKYQHDHYRLAQLQTELRLGPGAVYGVFLRTYALLMAPLLAAGALTFVAWQLLGGNRVSAATVGVVFALLYFGGGLFFYTVVLPYFKSRMQNLLWTKTGNRYLRFRSELRLRPYLWLQLKNYLLVAVTLGLYWPFAAVASQRMRLEAVTLVSRIELDDLYQALRPHAGDAAADMGDELMGFELGL